LSAQTLQKPKSDAKAQELYRAAEAESEATKKVPQPKQAKKGSLLFRSKFYISFKQETERDNAAGGGDSGSSSLEVIKAATPVRRNQLGCEES